MPLSNNILNAGLSRFMDPKSSSFKSEIDGKTGKFPENKEEFGDFWSKATAAYIATLSPAPKNPIAWAAGIKLIQSALSEVLEPAILPDPTNTLSEIIFNTAFSALGISLSTLIVFAGTPPGGAPTILSATPPTELLGTKIKNEVYPFCKRPGVTHAQVVEKYTEVISSWFKTGAYVPVPPPGSPPPPPINWS